MSNPTRPAFKYPIPVDVERDSLPPCPELRDMRSTRGMTQEELAAHWEHNWAAMHSGHSEGLAGSGGTLPERLDSGGWPIPDGAITARTYLPAASGHLPNAGHPAAGSAFVSAPAYPSPWAHPAPAYLAGSGHPAHGYPQGGHPPYASGHSRSGSSAGGRRS